MEYELVKKYDDAERAWRYEPSGDIDIHNSKSFQKEVLKNFKEVPSDVVIDAKNLIYLDSTGLGAFVAIYKEVSGGGYSLVFENVRKFVRKLFQITDMEKLFLIRSESDA